MDRDDLAQTGRNKIGPAPTSTFVMPMSYLYRVMRSVAIDTARQYARETRNTDPLNLNLSDACVVFQSLDSGYASQIQEASHLTVKETAEPDVLPRVNAMFDQLKPTLREPLALFAEGMTYLEIGNALQIPPGTVRSRIYYARKHAVPMLADLR